MSTNYIQVKFSRAQAIALLDLLADELEEGDPDAPDRPSLEAAEKIIDRGLDSLEARLERMKD